MDKEKEIEEMVDVLWRHCGNLINEYCEGESNCANCIAKKLTDAGYRKADEVRKETAKEILYYLKLTITDGLLKNHEIINWLMKEYGVELK